MSKPHAARQESLARVGPGPYSANRAEIPSQAPRPLDREIRTALIKNRVQYLRYYRRRLGTLDEAEDALQDFCLRALQYSYQLQDTKRLHGWLSRVLRSTLIDRYRRSAARDRLLAEFATFAPETEAGGETLECECFQSCLPTLRPDLAELVNRADIQGQPHAAIAAEMGLSVGNVAVKLHRARKALRKKLIETCQACPAQGFFRCGCGPARPATPESVPPTTAVQSAACGV